ncbi:addiction module antitoxin, RelB/DinJ family [Collinsella aerofaciens ATCC 25986]|uniref:Addiction module antitoxin, RelB/DinJ family n=3 Tax=Collinsella aerofaciens TaxID=74426 RepID=A4E9C7_COLAA|nr:addiction module antitoxin, RelB/DinJ family [Collinsella aerofaciens ATCC 25986]
MRFDLPCYTKTEIPYSKGADMPTSMLDTRPVQMNVRIDRQLKEAGDAVLTHIGMTPSQAVRTLWEYLVVNGRMPSKGDAAAPVSDGVEPMESRAAQGSHIVRDSCLKYGIPIPEFSGDYDDLYEEAMAERYPEWVEL